MNIEKLIAAANLIEELSIKQEEQTAKLLKLANAAKKTVYGSIEHLNIKSEYRNILSCQVDFSDAIRDIRAALKAKG